MTAQNKVETNRFAHIAPLIEAHGVKSVLGVEGHPVQMQADHSYRVSNTPMHPDLWAEVFKAGPRNGYRFEQRGRDMFLTDGLRPQNCDGKVVDGKLVDDISE